MTGLELFDLIHNNYCNGNVNDTLIEMEELITILNENPKKLSCELEEQLETECLANNKCYLCGSDLEFVTYEEDRGEYQGFPCTERITHLECTNYSCSYSTHDK